MKMVNLAVGLLLFSVAALLLLGANMVFHDPTHNQNATTNQTPSDPSTDLEFAGTVSFQFEGSNSSELIVAAGSAGHGTILMSINQAAPFLVFIQDSGALVNQSAPTLPQGISVSLNMYGKNFDVPSIYEVPLNATTGLPLSTVQLVSTTLGETSIQYTVSVANTVPAGVYKVNIAFESILKGDMLPAGYLYDSLYGYGQYYTVILQVQ